MVLLAREVTAHPKDESAELPVEEELALRMSLMALDEEMVALRKRSHKKQTTFVLPA